MSLVDVTVAGTNKTTAIIEQHEESIRTLFIRCVSQGGPIYVFDFIAGGVCDRAISISKGFRSSIENRNYVVSCALLRTQIDTLMRLYGLFIVPDLLDACEKIFQGMQFDKLKCRDGKNLKDFYLKDCLGEIYPWIPAVYKNANGFVHFSSKNVFLTFENVDEAGAFTLCIGGGGANVPVKYFEEVNAAFEHVLRIVIELFEELLSIRPQTSLPAST